MNRSVLTILFILSGINLYSQQPAQYTQYMLNKTYINPGATGTEDALTITGIGRHQWIGLKDENNQSIYPRTYQLTAEMPLFSIHSGLGISIENDQLGIEKNTNLRLNYAYHFKIDKFQFLSVGVDAEMMNKSMDFSQFKVTDPNDPLLNQTGTQKGASSSLGLGLFYSYPEKIYLGLSGMQLLGSSAKVGAATYNLIPCYNFMAGYDIWIEKSKWHKIAISPGILIRTIRSSTQYELNALLHYDEKYWGGLMYRFKDAAGLIAGIKIDKISVGLSYEYTLSDLRKAGSKGSLELVLRYFLPMKENIKMKGYYNPRYL